MWLYKHVSQSRSQLAFIFLLKQVWHDDKVSFAFFSLSNFFLSRKLLFLMNNCFLNQTLEMLIQTYTNFFFFFLPPPRSTGNWTPVPSLLMCETIKLRMKSGCSRVSLDTEAFLVSYKGFTWNTLKGEQSVVGLDILQKLTAEDWTFSSFYFVVCTWIWLLCTVLIFTCVDCARLILCALL